MKAKLYALAIMGTIAMAVAPGSEAGVSLGYRFDPGLVEEWGPGGSGHGLPEGHLLVQEVKRRSDYLGSYVGIMLMSLRLDMAIFDPMTADRDIDSFSDRVLLGGPMAGLIYKDLRVGVAVLSGDQHQSELIDNRRRHAFISYLGYGFFAEYSHMIERRYPRRVPYLRVGYLGGAMIGVGELLVRTAGPDVADKRWEARATVPFVNPYVGVWVSPFDGLWFQLDTGLLVPYLDTEAEEFVNDSDERMVDGDLSGGLQIGFKIVVGQNPNIYYEPPETF